MRPEFENDDPIDDAFVLLDLLCGPYGQYRTTREILRTGRGLNRESYARIGHHRDFSYSRYADYRVTERVIEQLLAAGDLQGKPHWGYTDMNELTASDTGRIRILELRKQIDVDESFRTERWFRETRKPASAEGTRR